MVLVSPEPEMAKMQSPALIAGEMVSPTTYELRPKCINLIANALAASPDLPAPVTKMLSAVVMISIKFAISSSTKYSSASRILSKIASIADNINSI